MFARISIACAAAASLWAAPALAQETALSAVSSVQVAEGQSAFDAQFSELFNSWADLENGGTVDTAGEIIRAPRLSASVPSRMPLDAVVLTSGFGMRNHPILRQRRQHQGVDLAAPRGTPVYATADGMVDMAQWYSSYGNYVQINHGGDMETRYAHLSSYTVRPGETVQKGALIGYVGSTGRSTGPHLHYEVRVANLAVDPRPYMVSDIEVAYAEEEQAARGGPE